MSLCHQILLLGPKNLNNYLENEFLKNTTSDHFSNHPSLVLPNIMMVIINNYL